MKTRTPSHPPKIPPITEAERPTWSVMVPVYNCLHYLREALESVLSQRHEVSSMQIEVIDDCSTDGDIEAVVNEVGQGIVTYFRQEENVGSLRNFETCLQRSKGRYVHLLHGDDRVEPGFYKEVGQLFQNHPDAGAAFTNYHYIDHTSQDVNIQTPQLLKAPGIIPNFIEKIGVKQLIQPPAIVVKRDVYEHLGSFFAAHYGEDWEMWARIASQYPIAYSPQVLASYRVAHGIGISHKSFRSGQNVTDMQKIIDLISLYLPVNKRAKIKTAALAHYARYCVRIANGLLLVDKTAAFKQVRGAWLLSRHPNTIFWILRFYAMHFMRYKQIQSRLTHGGPRSTRDN